MYLSEEEATESIIRFFSVTKIYPGGIEAIKGASFSIKKGEFVFVTGVFQDFKLLKDRTVFENICLPLEVIGYPLTKMEKRVRRLLKLVSLDEKVLDLPPLYLSGGEQQRVAIARALINNPSILLADEPTGNLDPALTIEIMDLLVKVNQVGTTVVVATHDDSLVDRYGRRAIVLRRGEIVAQ